MGNVATDSVIDEQQLSGHSWLLRGLCEYYLWRKDPAVLAMIKNIVENLFLPTCGDYPSYPLRPVDRTSDGSVQRKPDR